MNYTVTGGTKGRVSYFTSIGAALNELDERLFTGKLSKNQTEKKNDIKTLISLMAEHKEQIHSDFKKLSRLQAIMIEASYQGETSRMKCLFKGQPKTKASRG